MDNDQVKMLKIQRVGLLTQVDGIETLLGIARTAAIRKKYKELQGQMCIIKAWAQAKGYTLPAE